jgi:hypothetical protein
VAVALQINALQIDLKSFGRAAGKEFIDNHQRLFELETQLSNAALEARSGNRQLEWSTEIGEGVPIRTVPSRNYRGQDAQGMAVAQKMIVAEVSFKFFGSLDPIDDNRFIIQSGGTRVRLKWGNSEGEALYHFDIHPDAAGHPMLHFQFDGAISEVPRLHSIFAHPLDILEFTLMDVFQEKWRKAWTNTKFKNDIRRYPVHQRKRMSALLAGYIGLLTSPDPTLIALLAAPGVPVELYPP